LSQPLDLKNIGRRDKTSSQLAEGHVKQEKEIKIEHKLSEQNEQLKHEAEQYDLKLKHAEHRTIPLTDRVEQNINETKKQATNTVNKVEGALKAYSEIVTGKVQEATGKAEETIQNIKEGMKEKVDQTKKEIGDKVQAIYQEDKLPRSKL
jgi:uncharacterized protein YjbJ (UPF0337 family)